MKRVMTMALGFALLLAAPAAAVVTTTADWVSYTADGSDTTYDFDFGVWATSEVKVTVFATDGTPDLQVENSDYTVTLPNADGWLTPGGTVTFTTAPLSGYRVEILREIPLEQASNYEDADALDLATLEDDLDRAAVRDRQLLRELRRSLRAPEGTAVDMNLPAGWSLAVGYPYWDLAGWSLATPVLTDLSVSAGWSDLLDGTTASLANARAVRTQLGRMVYDVQADYGAAGNGVADDAAEIQAAIDAADAAGGGIVFLPEGIYEIGTGLTLPTNVQLVGAGLYNTFLEVTADVAAITTDAAAYGWRIKDFAIRPAEALAANTTTSAIVVGTTNTLFDIDSVYVTESSGAGAYDFQDCLTFSTAWTGNVRGFQGHTCTRYALYMSASGAQNITFIQCDFSGLDITACAYIAATACFFNGCSFQGWPLGLDLRGDRNVFLGSWFENDEDTARRCVSVTGGDYNQFIGGSFSVDAAGDHFYFNSGINNIIQNIVLASGGATQITFAGTSANNTVIGTDLETSMIAVGDTNTNTYSLWLPSTQNTMLLWQGSTGASSFQMAGGTTSGLALGTRMTATTIASVDRAGMYTTAGGGSAPFDVWGNLILKPDDQANLGVELWTGATPAVRLQVNETAVTAYKPLKDGASNTVTYYVAKTRKVTVGHKGETTTDFAWATAAGHAAANLDLGAVIPAHARVLDVTIICTEALVGQSDITIGAGNAAAGTQFFTAASCDELNETVASAAGAAAFVTASNAAQNLWLVGDPSDNNWSDQTAGMWKVFITYIDVASAE